MQELTTIVAHTMTVLGALSLLGIPIIIWEAFVILIRVVVRILFGAVSEERNIQKSVDRRIRFKEELRARTKARRRK